MTALFYQLVVSYELRWIVQIHRPALALCSLHRKPFVSVSIAIKHVSSLITISYQPTLVTKIGTLYMALH